MAGGVHGGAETFFDDLAAAFARAGVNQHIVTRPFPERVERLQQAGCQVTSAPFAGLLDVYTLWRVQRAADAFRPDVVLGWMNRAARALPRGDFVRVGRLGGYYNLKYYKKCDGLICNTRDIRDYVVREGWPADRAFYIPNFCPVGPEPALPRTSFDTPEGARILLVLARFDPVKGIDAAIRAMRHVPGAVLWIAGEGPLETELRTLAREEGVLTRVRFLGWRTDRAALLRAADICLVPSRYEPFGNVVVNAWAHGVPLIAAASDGPRALIEHETDGLLVPIGDAEALAKAAARVLDDSALAQRLIDGGLSKARGEYSEAAVVARYLEVFESLKTLPR